MAKDLREYRKAYYQAHKKEEKAKMKAYRQSHREEYCAYNKAYNKTDVNSSGQTKNSIRGKSNRFLAKHGKKIAGYEIHHCFTYDEPYKFIYCSHETHQLIHAYLKQHNIDAASDHYEQIKHLLNGTEVLYGIKEEGK